MGKRLIIKGADFSANGIYSPAYDWYNNGQEYSPETASGDWFGLLGSNFPDEINLVRIFINSSVVATQGTLKKGKVGQDIAQADVLCSFQITSNDKAKGFVDVELPNATTLADDESIMVSRDIACYYYHNNGDPDPSKILTQARTAGGGDTGVINTASTAFLCMQYGIKY